MTLKQLSRKSGISETELKRLLDSEVPNISIEQTAAVAEALNVTMNYLILGE